METPIDIILKHLGPEGTTGLTEHQLGMNIDLELQRKFLHFNIAEEIINLDITTDDAYGVLSAGSGPEEATCSPHSNPLWVLNRAINTLALYYHLTEAEKLAKRQAEVIARRPEPGVYEGKAARHFIAVVTEDRRILVQRTDGGFNDSTETYDAMDQDGDRAWKLRRINITDGTIEP